MSDKNDVVLIQLDRLRELRYGHKALKKLLAATGKNIEEIDMQNIDLEEVEKYIYFGLLSDAKANDETLRLEDMEDLLDRAPSYAHIIEKMTEAFNVAFGSFGEQVAATEGNQPAPAEKPADGTGKKA